VLAAAGKGDEVVQLEVMGLAAALTCGVDVGAARAVAVEDGAADPSWNVARGTSSGLGRLRRFLRRLCRRAVAALPELLDQRPQRTLVDLLDAVVFPAVREQRGGAFQQIEVLFGGGELHFVAKRLLELHVLPRRRG
jgi:hypothetical protein